MDDVGRIAECWHYPVKSFQGVTVERLELGPSGVEGDRSYGLVDTETGHLLSAKHVRELLEASATDHEVTLPDGSVHPLPHPATDTALSDWLGRPVRAARAGSTGPISYQMAFGPKGPDRRVVSVPTPDGTFLDVAAVHLLTTASLHAGAAARPDLDWDVRRFRPNLVVEVAEHGLVEDTWVGRRLRVGGAVLGLDQRTARCAMPMRAQHRMARAPDLFRALIDLNQNHLGLYCSVVEPGPVAVGDVVWLE